ncbi:uncharacterized protein F5Z01DRAFT_639934 [Emericellopsis atlantica]|uniref:Uncharacterized protein n=1 Tax=Emericellopsis atlantica TaxID=2614577 RepID=A0A9P8CMM5_9HYPO|nr:uncharacterized protein F5Z01DRAFT_639934 [Emericellopsis atlantica]KAG9250846.1 hypothetical protein F5Z01DRAFT_639934 [Emericellopsis atlantica]
MQAWTANHHSNKVLCNKPIDDYLRRPNGGNPVNNTLIVCGECKGVLVNELIRLLLYDNGSDTRECVTLATLQHATFPSTHIVDQLWWALGLASYPALDVLKKPWRKLIKYIGSNLRLNTQDVAAHARGRLSWQWFQERRQARRQLSPIHPRERVSSETKNPPSDAELVLQIRTKLAEVAGQLQLVHDASQAEAEERADMRRREIVSLRLKAEKGAQEPDKLPAHGMQDATVRREATHRGLKDQLAALSVLLAKASHGGLVISIASSPLSSRPRALDRMDKCLSKSVLFETGFHMVAGADSRSRSKTKQRDVSLALRAEGPIPIRRTNKRLVWIQRGDTNNADVPSLSVILGGIDLVISVSTMLAGNGPRGPFPELAYWIGGQPGVSTLNDPSYEIYRDQTDRPASIGPDQWVVFHIHLEAPARDNRPRADFLGSGPDGNTYAGTPTIRVFHGQYITEGRYDNRQQWNDWRVSGSEGLSTTARRTWSCPSEDHSYWYVGSPRVIDSDNAILASFLHQWGRDSV